MCQVYHSNAKTNQHIRSIIQKSCLTDVELANQHDINVKIISKWRNSRREKLKTMKWY